MPKFEIYVNDKLESITMSLQAALIFTQGMFNAYQEPNARITIQRQVETIEQVGSGMESE